jgi:hypothetical protein
MSNIFLPWSLENWIHSNTTDWFMMEEYQFFAPNAILSSQIEIGPYSLIFNCIAKNDTAQTLITARVRLFVNNQSKNELQETLSFDAHVGDEISGLISIGLGIKNFCAGMTRRFNSSGSKFGDRYGEPFFTEQFTHPTLRVAEPFPILPDVTATMCSLSDDHLSTLRNLEFASPERYRAFMRAACLYKDALDMVEHDPNLSWILMVSALEAGAVVEPEFELAPEQILKDGFPLLYEVLQNSTDNMIAHDVAPIVAPTLKATSKFIGFCLRYLPVEPRDRPDDVSAQVAWDSGNIKKCLSKIYGYRSRYLHTGQRFPSLMSSPPIRHEEKPDVAREKDWLSREWEEKDVPVNLHTFNYLTRHILLNWCKSFK